MCAQLHGMFLIMVGTFQGQVVVVTVWHVYCSKKGKCTIWCVGENMPWSKMLDLLASGQQLSGQEAEHICSAVFDGGVPDLELGGLLTLLEQRPMQQQEYQGALAALQSRVFQLSQPDSHWRPVVMPSYGVMRDQPSVLPLLALSLRRLGIPVLIHGMLSGGQSGVAYVLRELGVMPCATLSQAQRQLQSGQLAFVPTGALSPALAHWLSLRARLGGGAVARRLARFIDPYGGSAVQLFPLEDGQEISAMSNVLCDAAQRALFFVSADGEAVVNVNRRPAIDMALDGVVRRLFEAEGSASRTSVQALPAEPKQTAQWIQRVLAGRLPMPVPIANLFACCLYATGYAQDMHQAKAISAVETGSLAVA